MNGIFDITAYGAVGDGKTICTAAIQAALDDALQNGGGAVVVPPGIYKTGYLHMRAGTVLRGEAAHSYGKNGASVLSLCDESAPCLLDLTDAFGCHIREVCFDGCKLGNGIHGIALTRPAYNGGGHEDTPTLDDCRVSDFTGDGVHLNKIWCFSVRHSHLCFNRGAGLYVDGWDGFILDNWMSGNGSGGIRGGPISSSLTITGNRIEWNGIAGMFFGCGDSLNITGNFIDRSLGTGLVLGDGGTNDLFGLHHAPNRVRDATVTGNIFRRDGKEGALPLTDPYDHAHVRLRDGKNIVLTGNVFRHGDDDGGGGNDSPDYNVVLSGCDGVIVAENGMRAGCLVQNIVCTGKENKDTRIAGNVGNPYEKG